MELHCRKWLPIGGGRKPLASVILGLRRGLLLRRLTALELRILQKDQINKVNLILIIILNLIFITSEYIRKLRARRVLVNLVKMVTRFLSRLKQGYFDDPRTLPSAWVPPMYFTAN